MSSLKTGSQYFDDVGFVDVTDALAIEANASATNALTSRVSSVEGTITSQGQQITSMQNSIKNKADASAVTNLTNRVTAAENQISSQSQSITSLSNSLDNANADADASKAIIGNMLKNNSFERGFEGWEYVGWTLLEAQNPKSGKYIIQWANWPLAVTQAAIKRSSCRLARLIVSAHGFANPLTSRSIMPATTRLAFETQI